MDLTFNKTPAQISHDNAVNKMKPGSLKYKHRVTKILHLLVHDFVCISEATRYASRLQHVPGIWGDILAEAECAPSPTVSILTLQQFQQQSKRNNQMNDYRNKVLLYIVNCNSFPTPPLSNSGEHFYQGREIANDETIQYTDYLRFIKNTDMLKVKTEDPKTLKD